MPNEALNINNGSDEQIDAALTSNVRALALLSASLDAQQGANSYVLQSDISSLYNSIHSGFNSQIDSGIAFDIFANNFKNSSLGVKFDYLGLDEPINNLIDSSEYFSELQATVLKSAFNAIFFSSNIYNLNYSQLSGILSKTISYFNKNYNISKNNLNISLFPPSFSNPVLSQNYSSIFSYINLNSEKDSANPIYTYSFYDTTPIFSKVVDYQLMADSETQYYYVSGTINYNSLPAVTSSCVKEVRQNEFGTYEFILNSPCVDGDLSIGPISGLAFYRKFPDAPEVLTDEDLSEVYSEFNEAAAPNLYKHSNVLFSDPARKYKLGSINSDLQIAHSINMAEINSCPNPPQKCRVHAIYDQDLFSGTGYSPAHIGKIGYRWKVTGEKYDKGKLISQYFDYVNITGYKVIPLILNSNVWGDIYNSLKTNPDVPLENKLLRALNFGEYLTESGVGGPATIGNFSEIPCLYISEQLFNKTISTKQSGSFYLGTFSTGDGLELIPVMNGQLVTGFVNNNTSYKAGNTGSFPKLKFSFTINNTGFSGENSYYAQRCLGMGGSTGLFTTSGLVAGYNLGIPYSEFKILSGNKEVSINDFLSYADEGVLGKNGKSYVSYIEGYTSTLPSQTEKIFAYDEKNDLVTYNYFRPGTYGGITISQGQTGITGDPNWVGTWTGNPFPIPDGAENLTPIVKTQRKENYFPRYSKGPYALNQQVFLYPSASGTNLAYTGAFPRELEINLTVSEEIARKVFSIQEIYMDYYGNLIIREREPENPVFNFSKNFIYDLPYADEFVPSIENKKSWDLGEYVPNYWVDGNFIEKSDPTQTLFTSDSIQTLFTGLCSTKPTGILDTATFSVSSSVLKDFGNRTSGYYVLEYETGHYFGPVPENQENQENQLFPYRLQESDDSLGLFLIYSNGAKTKINLPVDSYEDSETLLNNLSLPIYHSFYHSGGDIKISGYFPNIFGAYATVTPFRIRLEKDCDLCAEPYFKYTKDSDINHGGCKYLPANKCHSCNGVYNVNERCLRIRVYPEGLNSEFEIKRNDPNFVQGVRSYHQEGWCCRYGYRGCDVWANYIEWHKIKFGEGPYDFYYQEIPKYDTHREFHYQTSKNYNLTIKYTLPSFSLFDKTGHPEYADANIQTTVPYCYYSDLGSPIYLIGNSVGHESLLFNRNNSVIKDGYDPIWFETIGGNSTISGGYHSKGLIGDSWIGFSADNYGISLNGNCYFGEVWWTRQPENDNFVTLLSLRPGFDLSLHTRALRLTPGYYDVTSECVKYDLTGMERVYNLPISGDYLFDSIIKAFNSTGFEEYSSYSSDYYYPKPGYFGDDGNINKLKYTGTNPSSTAQILKSSGLFEYWKDFVKATNDPSIWVTGVKYLDKSRINFKINSIKLTNAGSQPFDAHRELVLTGSCTISGEFGYDSQAESAVFSEGVFLEDHSTNYPLTGFYVPKFVSDVLLRIPNNIIQTPESPILPAPSRCLTRENIPIILESGNVYVPHLTQEPYNYNKFIVPALSDLSSMNLDTEEVGLEKVFANDGYIYPNSTFLLSAALAQHLGTNYETTLNIPNAPQVYYVKQAYQFYDSAVTDAVLNSGYFIKNKPGGKNTLTQLEDSSGILAPEGASYRLSVLGIYKRSGEL